MAASVLEVLCPTGHRQKVKTTPNMAILQVVEEVCRSRGLSPAHYELRHGRRLLDVTVKLRFAGLPNHAKLELVKSENVRVEGNVTVAVQAESERVQTDFTPATTLWDVLQYWKQLSKVNLSPDVDPGSHPVLTYMRDEVVGEFALRETTLRMMGLTRGRAMMRFSRRQVDENVLQSIREKIEKDKTRREKQEAKIEAQQHSGPQGGPQESGPQGQMESGPQGQMESGRQGQMESGPQEKMESGPQGGPQGSGSMETEEEEAMDVEIDKQTSSSMEEVVTRGSQALRDATIGDATLGDATLGDATLGDARLGDATLGDARLGDATLGDARLGEARLSDARLGDARLGDARLGDARLGDARRERREASLSELEQLPGVEVIRPDDFNHLSYSDQQRARRMAAEAFPGLFPTGRAMIDNQRGSGQSSTGTRQSSTGTRQSSSGTRQSSSGTRQSSSGTQPDFSNFKFPEATKGQSVYVNELSEVRSREEWKPCDRETCVYHLDTAAPSSQHDLPEDFYEVTVNDVRSLYSGLQQRTMDEQALMTSEMRRHVVEERMSRYDVTVIRLHFPDRHVVQAVFRPRETVFALQKFVKQHLEHKSSPFYLYTTPPRRLLKDESQTLFEANLVPLAVVYFGSDMTDDHHLAAAVMNEVGSREEAELIVNKHMDRGNPSTKAQSTSASAAASSSHSSSPSSSKRSSGEGGKVPKWFKVGKK